MSLDLSPLRRPWAAVALLTAVAAAVRLAGLGGQSFWVDEVVTAKLLALPLVDMLAELPSSESAPPLYYVLAWPWARVVGADETGLRSLSALAGTLTIPVVYAAATALVSRAAALVAAALATVSPLLVWYSQEARAYALFVLLGALSFLFFSRALADRTPRALALWAVASALAVATHYFGVFLVAAEAALLLRRHRTRAALVAVAAVGAAGLALLPLAAYQAVHASSRWIRDVSLPLRVEETVRQLLVPGPPSIWAGAGVAQDHAASWWPLGLALLAAATTAAVLRGTPRERSGALVALAVGAAAVGVPLLMAVAAAVATGGRGDVFLYRNAIAAWLPLTVVLAAGARSAGRLGMVAAAALVAWSAGAVVVNARTETLQRDDWRLVARALSGGGDRIVVLSPSWQVGGLEYHVPGLAGLGGGGATVREVDLLVREHVPSYSLAVRRLRLPPAFEAVETTTLQNWVLTRYRAPHGVRVRPGEVRPEPPGASAVALVREG